ncbi:hypothetical protein PDJAM_G00266730 [Pangasius djambal]|nr:hypothetical protein [Pangasius djambal]
MHLMASLPIICGADITVTPIRSVCVCFGVCVSRTLSVWSSSHRSQKSCGKIQQEKHTRCSRWH